MVVVDATGRAQVYYGSSGGLPTVPSLTLASTGYGSVAESAGDVDGDGFGYLVVSSNFALLAIYRGGSGGLSDTLSVTAPWGSTSSSAGASVASGGDLNGDGYADLVVGVGPSTIEVFYGSKDDISTTPNATVSGLGGLGFYVAMIGDVNGDGYTDLFAGSPLPNTVLGWVFYGAPAGVPSAPSLTMPLPEGVIDNHVRLIGDVNGDGYADVMSSGGRAIFNGGASGLPATPTSVLAGPSIPGHTVSSRGLLFVGIGDVDGDGFDDTGFIVIDEGSTRRSGVYLGGGAGLSPASVSLIPNLPAAAAPWMSGYNSILGTGDVDGDGRYDLANGLVANICPTSCTVVYGFRTIRGTAGGIASPVEFAPPSGTNFDSWGSSDRAYSGL
jgi:hypothetical protein